MSEKKRNLVAHAQELVKGYEEQITGLLPSNIDVERFTQTVYWAIRAAPKLLTVAQEDPASLIGAVLQCAETGLVPNTGRGECFIIPYNETRKDLTTKRDKKILTAQFQMGYVGVRTLAMRNPAHVRIWADLVYDGDDIDIRLMPERTMEHIPRDKYGDETTIGQNGDGLIGAYAVVRYSDGSYDFEWRPLPSLNKIREDSKKRNYGKESPAWINHQGQQYKKTALIRFVKTLELGEQEAKAMHLDDLAAAGKRQNLGAMIDGDATLEGYDDDGEDGPSEPGIDLPPDHEAPKKAARKPAKHVPKKWAIHDNGTISLSPELEAEAKTLEGFEAGDAFASMMKSNPHTYGTVSKFINEENFKHRDNRQVFIDGLAELRAKVPGGEAT